MSETRRDFLHSAAAAATLAAAMPGGEAQVPAPAAVQVPKVKFGKAEISRIVVGGNQPYGYSHFNRTYDQIMREWYTPEKVVEVLLHANEYGINAFQALASPRCYSDCARLEAAGGKMHYLVQASSDPAGIVKALKPLAIYHAGELTDRLFQTAQSDQVREWCKRVRQTGVMVGVGSHNPEFLAMVEEQGWDVDFYSGCVYYRTRTADEWKSVVGKEMLEGSSDIYLQSDPPRMYSFIKRTPKPCFAFKVLAAGRVSNVQQAFRTAFSSIKPTDCLYVGMFPRIKDEVKENAEIVTRILTSSS
jgi:hypothetical protein